MRNAFTGFTFVHCHYCGETISVSQPMVSQGSYRWHAACAPANRAERCCFEGCNQPVTRKLGGEVYFPVCESHAERLQP